MPPAEKSTIGSINGKWQILFKVLLALNACAFPPALTWAIFVTTQLIELKYNATDRFTGSMFIEVQDLLHSKNPTAKWLDASEIRTIQRNNAPYAR